MTFLLLLVMLPACAAIPRDLTGKVFNFPTHSIIAHVRLTTPIRIFRAITVCHRSITDLQRDHVLFSMATSSYSNALRVFWDHANKEMKPSIIDKASKYPGLDYRPNMWHSICTTYDSASYMVQLWFNGQPSVRRYVYAPSISGSGRDTVIILGQEQDSYGGDFDFKQSFVGKLSDIHMWDYALSPCEIQKYVDGTNFTAGNVLNWGALEFVRYDRVFIEDKQENCV
ncbi:serum amyloid P-component-like [Sebastes fasciatus]|uniref:serum amyloid P-component-like n=1 Tax=Sebastes fasciatus TaxID=394691 RepID=UPI003D9F6468